MWKVIGILIYLLVLSFMDVRERKIGVAWVAAGAAAVSCILLYEGLTTEKTWSALLCGSLLGAIPGLFMLAVARLTGKAGYGDGLVLILLGACCGYLRGMMFLCLSLFLLSLGSVVLLFCGRVRGNTQMPYLPFLTLAYACIEFLKIG